MKKIIGAIIFLICAVLVSFYIGRYTKLIINFRFDWNTFISSLLGPMVVGVVLWQLGVTESSKKTKQDAIIDLMTYRGDYSSPDFTKSLNKVAIIFHDDQEIREDIRKLYGIMNNPSNTTTMTERSIVGLIYKLCQRHDFSGLSEYDIDQSFIKSNQSPDQLVRNTVNSSVTPATLTMTPLTATNTTIDKKDKFPKKKK